MVGQDYGKPTEGIMSSSIPICIPTSVRRSTTQLRIFVLMRHIEVTSAVSAGRRISLRRLGAVNTLVDGTPWMRTPVQIIV